MGSDATSDRTRPSRLVLSLVLVLGVALVFGQVITFQFLSFDDPLYVTENQAVLRGLTLRGLRWAFVTHHASLWQPLTWMSHMVDVEVWGRNPGGHHLGSLALHAASAVVLFCALDRLTGERLRSWLVAALFALHPLRADSVAWVAERKDTLSTFFMLATLLAYAVYVEAPSAGRFWPVVLAFAAALLSKPMAIAFPAALLLVDAWPLRRFGRVPAMRLMLEKAPLFVLSLGAAVLTFHAHGESIAATPGSYRWANAVVSYARHFGHFFWPSHLSIFYPRTLEGAPALALGTLAGSIAVVAVLGVIAVVLISRAPYVSFGLAWFAGLLFPVSGVIQSGLGAMADRFTYVPSIGLAVAVVWLAAAVLDRWNVRVAWRVVLASLVVATSGIATFLEVANYRDTPTVFAHAIASTGSNWMAESHLGQALLAAGDVDGAIQHFRREVAIVPDAPHAQEELGNALEAAGRSRESIDVFERVLRDDPAHARAQNAVCVSLVSLQRFDEAVACLRRAITLDPSARVPYVNLEMLYENTGRPDLAQEVRAAGQAKLGPPRSSD